MIFDDHNLKSLKLIAKKLKQAKQVLFITGAGISADSGLPTYRSSGGLYDQDKPTADGISIEEALSYPQFVKNPAITWKYLKEIELLRRGKKPNDAHYVITKLSKRLTVYVLTQNIDGLHKLAENPNVIDIHGDLYEVCCTACNWQTQIADYSQLPADCLCPDCQMMIRPRVTLFGEMLDTKKTARLDDLLAKPLDIVFSIGTSSLFPYITYPLIVAKKRSKTTVEINPEPALAGHLVDIQVAATAKEALLAIWDFYTLPE